MTIIVVYLIVAAVKAAYEGTVWWDDTLALVNEECPDATSTKAVALALIGVVALLWFIVIPAEIVDWARSQGRSA